MDCALETTFTVGPCGGQVRLVGARSGRLTLNAPAGDFTPPPTGPNALGSTWITLPAGDYTLCIPANCPITGTPEVQVVDDMSCAGAVAAEPEPEPIPQIDVETKLYCDPVIGTLHCETITFTDGVPGTPVVEDKGIDCKPEDPPLDIEKVRECRDGFINIVTTATAQDGTETELSAVVTEEPCYPKIDIETDVVCDADSNTWVQITTTFENGVETGKTRFDTQMPCDEDKPDIEKVRECRNGVIVIVTTMTLSGVETETSAVVTAEPCTPDPVDPTLFTCPDDGQPSRRVYVCNKLNVGLEDYETECTAGGDGQIITILSKYPPGDVPASWTNVGKIDGGQPQYGNWPVYAACAPVTVPPDIAGSTETPFTGDPDTVIAGIGITWTRGTADPVCPGTGGPAKALLMKHCGPITVEGQVLDSILAALQALNDKIDHEVVTHSVCNATSGTWVVNTTLYQDGVAGTTTSFDTTVPCTQPDPADDYEIVAECRGGFVTIVTYKLEPDDTQTELTAVATTEKCGGTTLDDFLAKCEGELAMRTTVCGPVTVEGELLEKLISSQQETTTAINNLTTAINALIGSPSDQCIDCP